MCCVAHGTIYRFETLHSLKIFTMLKLFKCDRESGCPLISTFTAACENQYVSEINFYCHW